mgnify:FL=1
MSVIEKNLNVQNGSVLKTFQILDCFTLEQPIHRIGDLCEKTRMNRSTLFRFMNSLNEIGIVERNQNGSYKLGIKLFELGIKVDVSASLAAKGQPFLKSLADSVQESVHMVVRDKVEVLYILKEESTNSIRIDSAIGLKRPMYCTGVGKAILAFMGEDYMNVYYEYQNLDKRTDNTFTTQKALNAELGLIRDTFTSIDDEEFAEHVYCVATPVFDSNSKPVAAVSVSGLKNRMVEKKELLIEKVLEAGKLITKEIGGEYPITINNQKIGV